MYVWEVVYELRWNNDPELCKMDPIRVVAEDADTAMITASNYAIKHYKMTEDEKGKKLKKPIVVVETRLVSLNQISEVDVIANDNDPR
jgi:hypothetical protein